MTANAVAALAAQCRATVVPRQWRHLLWLAGPAAWCREEAGRALAGQDSTDVTWCGVDAPPGVSPLSAARARGRLGTEVTNLVIDSHAGLDVDALGALAGTLRGGGLLLLLTPPAEAWPDAPDPALARWLSAPYGPHDGASRYRRRLVRLLRGHPAVTRVTPEHSGVAPLPPPGTSRRAPAPLPDALGCLTKDQHAAVDAILALAVTAVPHALVLTADRGRGKSAALGLAARRLAETRYGDIVVTAPHRSALRALYEAASLPPDAAPRFVPPDELLRHEVPCRLLLVDEAAAIPAPLLTALLERHSRIVFATTVHGYEGTGRGFALRFRATLDRIAPGWHELGLRTPVRWAADDPLEPLLNRALLLDARSLEDASALQQGDLPPVRRFDRDRLVQDEVQLGALCGLLVDAHYRTTPNDLRVLLDAPGTRLLAAGTADGANAVALTVDEGGFAAADAFAAWAGVRRRRGHLVAQSLAAHAGLEDAARLTYRRVQRIAVHPRLRRRGLGRRLVTASAEAARADGCDLLCTSFGADASLFAFWRACGFVPARVGFRRDAASGLHSAVMLQPLTPRGETFAATALQRLGRDLPILLDGALADLDETLVAALHACIPAATPGDAAHGADWREACAFAFARRAPDAARPALNRLLPHMQAALERGDPRARALGMRVRDHAPWAAVAAELGVAGRSAATAQLRACVGAWLVDALPPEHADLPARLAALC